MSNWSQEVSVALDVLDAALWEALPKSLGFSFEREQITLGSVCYKLYLSGKPIGVITIRKGTASCWLSFRGPDKPKVPWTEEDKARLKACSNRKERLALLHQIEKEHSEEEERQHRALLNAYNHLVSWLEYRLSQVDMPFFQVNNVLLKKQSLSGPIPDGLTEDDKKLWQMYDSGEDVKAIADALCLSEKRVRARLTMLHNKGLAYRFPEHWRLRPER